MLEIEKMPAKKGGYTMQVTFYDEEIRAQKKLYLCSRIDPKKEAKEWAEHVYDASVKCFIIYGIGLAYHIEALRERLDGNQKIYVIDCNKQLVEACKPYISEAIWKDTDITYLITNNVKELQNLINAIDIETAKFEAYLPVLKLIPSHLIGIKHVVERQILKKHTQERFSEKIRSHYEQHALNNYPNVSEYFGKYKGKKMILVSAGPSLDSVLETLKVIDEEMVIFATGRVLRLLVEKGIRVDFFCIIDPYEDGTTKQIQGVNELNIPFIFLNTVSHQTVDYYKGPKYIAYSMDFPEEQEGRIETGGSVATAVLELGIRFGFSEIIFVGQDLAYSNGVTHCSGVSGKVASGEATMRKVKGIDGSYLPTTLPLLNFKRWIEDKIKKHPEVRFINCTTKGAYIEGCEHIKLQEVITK